MSANKHLILICGPTGIGKTSLAIRLAQKLNCEIISADSRQLFKEMRIGTAVPSAKELLAVPHHFIQSHSVSDYYNASMYEQEVIKFLEEYFKQKNVIIMVGGSGMYIDAVCKGIDELPAIDPALRKKWDELFDDKGLPFLQEKLKDIDLHYYEKVDLQNHKRLLKAIEVYEQTGKPYSSFLKRKVKKRPFEIHKIGLNMDREELYGRINQRVDIMIDEGLIGEAEKLVPFRDSLPLKTVGYKELFRYFDGEHTLQEAIIKIKDHSRAYARRQLTWFRRDSEITWFEPDEFKAISERLTEKLKNS